MPWRRVWHTAKGVLAEAMASSVAYSKGSTSRGHGVECGVQQREYQPRPWRRVWRTAKGVLAEAMTSSMAYSKGSTSRGHGVECGAQQREWYPLPPRVDLCIVHQHPASGIRHQASVISNQAPGTRHQQVMRGIIRYGSESAAPAMQPLACTTGHDQRHLPCSHWHALRVMMSGTCHAAIGMHYEQVVHLQRSMASRTYHEAAPPEAWRVLHIN